MGPTLSRVFPVSLSADLPSGQQELDYMIRLRRDPVPSDGTTFDGTSSDGKYSDGKKRNKPCCAISGLGKALFRSNLTPGLFVFPIVHKSILLRYVGPSPDDEASTRIPTLNQIPMLSHLYEFFARGLISIHPTTHRVQVFSPSEVTRPYHGRHVPGLTAEQSPAIHLALRTECLRQLDRQRHSEESPPRPGDPYRGEPAAALSGGRDGCFGCYRHGEYR